MATRDQQKIGIYRRQVQSLHVWRQWYSGRHRLPNFLALLSEEDGVYCWDVYEAPDLCLCSDECKDRTVDRIRHLCQSDSPDEGRVVAIWFAVEGWKAPTGRVSPRRHPERKQGLVLFESTIERDAFGFLADDVEDCCWSWETSEVGGRFVNLIGRESKKPALQVVPSTVH